MTKLGELQGRDLATMAEAYTALPKLTTEQVLAEFERDRKIARQFNEIWAKTDWSFLLKNKTSSSSPVEKVNEC